jgi:hypothetical protein
MQALSIWQMTIAPAERMIMTDPFSAGCRIAATISSDIDESYG